jgi:hypothetical protein
MEARLVRIAKGMHMHSIRWTSIAFLGMTLLAGAAGLNAQDPEKWSEEKQREFLLNAKIVGSRPIGKGLTNSFRLTLSDETAVHDAAFQSIDEYKPYTILNSGKTEINFRDSYKYNIAAFELAKLVGLGAMMPVTVERKWEGKIGSLSWWLPKMMDERERTEKRIKPPYPKAWNEQMHRLRVFAELVYDTDRNLGNVLISKDWHIWMIDFTRAFRLHTALEDSKNLTRCDRRLLLRLRQLDAAELAQRMDAWLNDSEIKGVLARRDLIVQHFERLVAQNGEKAVLYDSTTEKDF